MQDTSFIFCQMALHLNVGLEPGSDAARIFSVDRNVYSGCYVSSTSDLMQEDLREWFSGKPERLVHALSGLEFTIGPFKV